MKNNINKYNSYNSVDPESIENEDIDLSSYPQDAYVKPGDAKIVGKMDDYNKEKANFNRQKSKVVLKESNIAPQDKKLDDLIPADIGNAIDNVFSKVDNLLNATGKLFFGSNKNKSKLPKPSFEVKDTVQKHVAVKPNNVVVQPAPVQQIQAKPTVAAQPQLPKPVAQPAAKPVVAQAPAVKSSIVRPAAKPKAQEVEEVDNSPLITRTTMIADLDLPIELLGDPDLVRYFEQMKLYDKKVDGGLCSLTEKQASDILRKGRWGKLFMIDYSQLKINTIMTTADAGTSRFNGMLPVYKAQGRKFTNTEELRRAIEKDINMYLKNGQGSGEFHKFTYRRK